ncbi:MAG TPA: substrate-binding domain-containing protein [Gammaproteobacteria bacterium]|nr:substrate-binding domain-containing protein [Gammaproteobacteria bacterium]
MILAALAALIGGDPALAAQGRDQINIVGSSTVYPFTTVVAERFGKTTKFKTPKIEATGTGGGIKLFCQGVGVQHPDIANASRRMKSGEFDICKQHGVTEILEVRIGYDGIVLSNSKTAEPVELSLKDIYLALAKEVPDPGGGNTFVPNPYKTWNQVNPKLSRTGIEVLGPPPSSGTRDAFNELAVEGGCSQFAWIKNMKKTDEKGFEKKCRTIREDGAYIEATENDNLIVQKLLANPDALGVFGFSFLDQNLDKVQGALINGKAPTFENIAEGSYPISRPLYFYVKKAHIGRMPGILEFVQEFTSKRAMGEEGYLAEKGLIPLAADEYQRIVADVKALQNFRPGAE